MPEAVTNELLYEVLKNVQGQLAVIREDVGGIKARMTNMLAEMAGISGRMDRLETRMERVETRLGLIDHTH